MAPGYYDINPYMGLYGSIPQNTMGLPLQSGTYTPDSLHLATVLSGNQLASNCCDAYANPFLNPYSANAGMTGDTISFMTNMINALPQFGPNQGGLMNMLGTFWNKFQPTYSNTTGAYSSTPTASLTSEEKIAAAEKQAEAKVAIEKNTNLIKRICEKAGLSASNFQAPSSMTLEEQSAYYERILEKLKTEYKEIWNSVEKEVKAEEKKAAETEPVDPEKEAREAEEKAKKDAKKTDFSTKNIDAGTIAESIRSACSGISFDNTVKKALRQLNKDNILDVLSAYGVQKLNGFWGFAALGGGYHETMIESVLADLDGGEEVGFLNLVRDGLVEQANVFELTSSEIDKFKTEFNKLFDANTGVKDNNDRKAISNLVTDFANKIIAKRNEFVAENDPSELTLGKLNPISTI